MICLLHFCCFVSSFEFLCIYLVIFIREKYEILVFYNHLSRLRAVIIYMKLNGINNSLTLQL